MGVTEIHDRVEALLRAEARLAFMEGLKLGGKLPTLKEGFEARDRHAEEVVQRWRSAR